MVLLLAAAPAARAQGPTIDPTFQPTAVYRPAVVSQVAMQADGKLLVLSNSTRAGSAPAAALTRLLPGTFQPDLPFIQHTSALRGGVRRVVPLPTGQVLLVADSILQLGNLQRRYLLRLNADGTPDAGFDAALPAFVMGNPIQDALGQPDGRVLLLGYVSMSGYATLPPLTRLLADGQRDVAFEDNVGNFLHFTTAGANLALQPDGSILVPGEFLQSTDVVRRLLPSGLPDVSFVPAALPVLNRDGRRVVRQPDGRLLVSASNAATSGLAPVVRLLSSGALDPSFQSAATFGSPTVQLQADGRLVVQSYRAELNGAPAPRLLRLLPDGSFDNTFNASGTVAEQEMYGLQLLPDGTLLVTGPRQRSSGPVAGVALLAATGSRVPGWALPLAQPGIFNDVAQLPGGGYLVGGDFTEINGLPLAYLARLSATGVPDATFPAAAPPDGPVHSLLVQPDGQLLLAGAFEQVAGAGRVGVARLAATGTLDAGFAPPFVPIANSRPGNELRRLARLPDGRVLLTGPTLLPTATTPENRLRLLDAATGQPDLALPYYQAQDVLVQPNGRAVVAGFDNANSFGGGATVFRLLANGLLDPSFTPLSSVRSGLGGGPVATQLAQDAAGGLACLAYFYSDTNPFYTPFIFQMPADGGTGPSLTNSRLLGAQALAVQPNGRLLVGADLSAANSALGLSRLTPSLTLDPTFSSAGGPLRTVRRLAVQADGAILAVGDFQSVGGQAIGGLVRLLAANVLRVASRPAAPLTRAWPVPAHGQLHLALEAAARPSRVELLDALGRRVLSQPATAALTLDIASLPAGAYVLRVHYASGPVMRRVVVE